MKNLDHLLNSITDNKPDKLSVYVSRDEVSTDLSFVIDGEKVGLFSVIKEHCPNCCGDTFERNVVAVTDIVQTFKSGDLAKPKEERGIHTHKELPTEPIVTCVECDLVLDKLEVLKDTPQLVLDYIERFLYNKGIEMDLHEGAFLDGAEKKAS